MHEPADNLAISFARRLAERDDPPPPSLEPEAVQARIEGWLRRTYHMRDGRSCLRMGRMLRALIEHPERTGRELATAAGLPERSAARAAARLSALGLVAWERRSYYQYWRLLPATEDALLLVVAGPAGLARA